PTDDHAARVEHVDGVILDRLDQHAKAALAVVQRVLRLAALGDVAGDNGKANGAAIMGTNRLHRRGDPEPGAVLADPPSLVLGAAGQPRPRQELPGKIGGPVFGPEKQRKVLTDDLTGAVEIDLFGAQIPGADNAFGVDQIDGVVGQGIEQEFKPTGVGQLLDGTGKAEFHKRP